MLSPHTIRCQGRTYRVLGVQTLDLPCTDCERRTAPMHPTVKAQLMVPPATGYCLARIPPQSEEEAVC